VYFLSFSNLVSRITAGCSAQFFEPLSPALLRETADLPALLRDALLNFFEPLSPALLRETADLPALLRDALLNFSSR
jgi:hypothetical protein